MTSDLPVSRSLPGVLAAMSQRGVAVLVASPGAGKSTLVPLALLDAPWRRGKVLMLEPRRLAARTLANRLATLLGERVGDRVGYRMRGETKVSARTEVEVVTQGVLTRMLQHDPSLDGVDTVVFDEFHERSLEADLGLALALESRAALRPDLRLLVMSATLDAAGVAALLGGAAVIESAGRAFPVAVIWAPPDPRQRWEDAVAALVRRAVTEQPEGDVLVFLPGRAEIGRVGERLVDLGDIEVVPLHGSVDHADQDRLFQDGQRRRIILATSIAETSITLPGVRVVVDAGQTRRPHMDTRRGMSGLETVRVSKASAEQRRGRAGRMAPGVCYRLWGEADHAGLSARSQPEIISADLASLALELAVWGVERPSDLAWLDPPPPGLFAAGREMLSGVGALDDAGRITNHGRALAELGLHPRTGHLVLEAHALGLGPLGCAVAAVIDDLRPGPTDARERVVKLDAAGRTAAERLWRRFGGGGRFDWAAVRRDIDEAGRLLALAYPDRVALGRVGGEPGRFVLANGSGAFVAPTDVLARSTLVAVADLQLLPGRSDARIGLGAPIDEADLPGPVRTTDEVVWDPQAGDVRARRRRKFGALVLAESPLAAATAGATAALLDGIRAEGLSLLPWSAELVRWRERVGYCCRVVGDPWPDLSDAALRENLDGWLPQWLGKAHRRADLARIDLSSALKGLVGWPLAGQLDELAPTHIQVPSGNRIRVDYETDPPVLAVKLQECFGLATTPTVGGGRTPLVLHLLSPAGRPAAVTSDLESFWRTGYPKVRSELRGRYPRHPWPEDPLTATPTARTKRRNDV